MLQQEDIQGIKSLLYRSWTAQAQIEADAEVQQRLRFIAGKVTPTLSQAPCHGSDQDKLSGIIAKIVDLDNKIQDDINELVKAMAVNREIINDIINDKHRLILQLRYLNKKRWEDIAVMTGKSWQGTHKLHVRALLSAKRTKKYLEIMQKG